LGATGTRQGVAFTLVGRLQYGYAGGTWNEWHALFDNGSSGWLSEDNGAYVLAFDKPLPGDVPAMAALSAGQSVVVEGRPGMSLRSSRPADRRPGRTTHATPA
jgi:hypothetical protein